MAFGIVGKHSDRGFSGFRRAPFGFRDFGLEDTVRRSDTYVVLTYGTGTVIIIYEMRAETNNSTSFFARVHQSYNGTEGYSTGTGSV
jgi:hypothetical protein